MFSWNVISSVWGGNRRTLVYLLWIDCFVPFRGRYFGQSWIGRRCQNGETGRCSIFWRAFRSWSIFSWKHAKQVRKLNKNYHGVSVSSNVFLITHKWLNFHVCHMNLSFRKFVTVSCVNFLTKMISIRFHWNFRWICTVENMLSKRYIYLNIGQPVKVWNELQSPISFGKIFSMRNGKKTTFSFRNVNGQRLLSGDASQVHLAGIIDNKLSTYVQQNKIRLDRKYVLIIMSFLWKIFGWTRNSVRRSGFRPKPVHAVRENGDISALQGRMQDDYDIKVFQYRQQQAELKRYKWISIHNR